VKPNDVLDDEQSDDRFAVYAELVEGLEVGLDTGAAAWGPIRRW
jgi:hypothetical protein